MHASSIILGYMVGGTSSFISGGFIGVVISACVLHILSLQYELYSLTTSSVVGMLVGVSLPCAIKFTVNYLFKLNGIIRSSIHESNTIAISFYGDTLLNSVYCALWAGNVALVFWWSEDVVQDTSFPTGLALSYLASVLVSVIGYLSVGVSQTPVNDVSMLVFHIITAAGVSMLLLLY